MTAAKTPAEDDYKRVLKNQHQSIIALTEAALAIAKHFNVCPLCLMYETADAAQDAEESGDAVHGLLCDTPGFIHPPHKTVS